MKISNHKFLDFINGLAFATVLFLFVGFGQAYGQERHTEVTIEGDQFYINGNPTYEGKTWITSNGEEYPIEGLLMNARLIQGTFDDLNPKTRGQWAYPDTREWNPDRNTKEFVDAMASWREHGLLGIAVNLQGGCPYGYCGEQRWDNSAFAPDGSLREGYMNRLERILDRADELGMVAILGYFYFGQDDNLQDEQAVLHAVENATEWILRKGYRNVVVEINNECNVRYDDHPILQCDRVHELIERVRDIEYNGRSLYVSTSLAGGSVPPPNIVHASDYTLLHGNGVENPERIVEMVREVREMEEYSPMPIVFNEDDQPWRIEEQGWGEEGNNFVASVKNYASWGYFDFRRPQENDEYNEGYQSVPVNWQISSERKRNFFDLLAKITDSPGTPHVQINFDQNAGKGSIGIDKEHPDTSIEKVELIINNEIIATAEAPFDFSLYEFGYELPAGEHWVRARVTYKRDDRKVIVESPYYRNPWWPYGGW
jgi:hypothetical protein